MKLTRVERWILSKQYRILEALYPDEAEDLSYAREAVEDGYELEYDWMAQAVYEDSECLSSEGCGNVLDILEMFRSLKSSYEALEDKSGIDQDAIKFLGFSGNEEGPQMAYARHFCDGPVKKYPELDRGDNFNSHYPVLGKYRRMLDEWHKSEDEHELSKEDIVRIIDARMDPSPR